MTLFKKIYIHPLTILLSIVVALTGMYKDFLIIFLIIIIHEFGHLLMALLFKWNIDKISIYPYGGCVKFNEKINRPLKEELLILISGPFFQILFFIIITILYKNSILSFRNYLLFKTYHYTLLLFNLLPIYPLDGGKILNVLLEYIFPYKKSNKLIIILSYLVLVFLLISYKNINLIMMSTFLIIEITLYLKRQDYLFNKFLLERYLNDYNFKKKVKISYIYCSSLKSKLNLFRQKPYIKFNPISYGNGIDKSFGSLVKIILFEYATIKPNSNIVPFPILPSGLHTIIASAFLNLFI